MCLSNFMRSERARGESAALMKSEYSIRGMPMMLTLKRFCTRSLIILLRVDPGRGVKVIFNGSIFMVAPSECVIYNDITPYKSFHGTLCYLYDVGIPPAGPDKSF